MKVLGITGQVGAGKSTILAYLEEKYRAKVIQADQVGHLVMEPDTSCYKQICSLFGEQILAADQKIDRKKLGAIVFADQEACHVKCDRSSGSERIHSNCRLSGKTKGMCAVCGRGGSSFAGRTLRRDL